MHLNDAQFILDGVSHSPIFIRNSWHRYQALPILAKVLLVTIILFTLTVFALVLAIGPSKATQELYNVGQQLASYRFGWAILGVLMIIVSFPPMIFYTTLVWLCGFAYGLKGFFIAAPGSLLGSAIAFVVLRRVFGKRVRQWTASNKHWQALEAVIRTRGLPLIILIRASPFPPWSYSSSFFASVESVQLWQFVTATLFVLPKLFLMVFIGSRVAQLADGEQRDRMDMTTKVLNIISILLSASIGILAGFVTYYLLQQHVKAAGESSDVVRTSSVDESEGRENVPLLHDNPVLDQ